MTERSFLWLLRNSLILLFIVLMGIALTGCTNKPGMDAGGAGGLLFVGVLLGLVLVLNGCEMHGGVPLFRTRLGKPPIRPSTLGQMTGDELMTALSILEDDYWRRMDDQATLEDRAAEERVQALYEQLQLMIYKKAHSMPEYNIAVRSGGAWSRFNK